MDDSYSYVIGGFKMGWRNYVKDGLAMTMVVTLTSLPPSVIMIWHGKTKEGLLFTTVAITMFTVCMAICAYWHKRDIHISGIGFFGTMGIFLANPFVVWRLGFTPYPNIIISLYFLSKPTYCWIRDFIKKRKGGRIKS